MVASRRRIASLVVLEGPLPLDLRPFRDGCAVNHCEQPVVTEMAGKVIVRACAFDRDRLKAQGWKERSLL